MTSKTIKRPYESKGMWAVEMTTDEGEFAGFNRIWCATQAEAEQNFNFWVERGWTVMEEEKQSTEPQHFDSGMMYDQPQPAPDAPAKRTPLYTTVDEAARVLSEIAGEPISVFDPYNDGYWVATCRRASRNTLKNRAAYIEWERSIFALQDRVNAAGIYSGYESVYVSGEDERWATVRFNVSHPKVWGVKVRSPFAR